MRIAKFVAPSILALVLVALSGCASGKTPDGGKIVVHEPVPTAETSASPEAIAEAGELSVAPEPARSVRESGEVEPPPEEEVDLGRLLHDSLDAYESATLFWKEGAIDEALAALDEAYGLMAEVPSNGDAALAQEKENLRSLIAKRVIEIYASRATSVGDLSTAIPLVINDEVEREIRSFQTGERKFFLESYQRSGLYRPMIVEKLRAAGLPEQISWLPLVESGFKVRALSSARALGLWQFIPSTGYRYGLDRDSWIDERMDPEKATDGAIAYLTALHNLFGDWLTALAGYNCGEHNVLKAINRQSVSYFDQFWDLYLRLPRETRRYVPRFLATLAILEDPAKYGMELPEPFPPIEADRFRIDRPAQLSALDKALGLPDGTLAGLNPELRRKAVGEGSYDLRVPKGTGPTILASLPEIPKWVPPANVTHRVRSGETLSVIAKRYGTSVNAIMAMNRLRSAHRIWPGQQLQVPGGGGGWTGGSGGGVYVVQRGDTLGKIAAHRGVALSKLLAANGLSVRSTIYPGQRLTIPD